MEIASYILYENSQYIVCHKPSGLAVQSAGIGVMDLESGLKNYLAEKSLGEIPYLGLVHRLDQPVEGLVVFGKTKAATASLSSQAASGKMKKYYLAASSHRSVLPEQILEHILIKDRKNNCSRAVESGVKGGKKARLFYRLADERNGKYLYEICLYTGRHHQIRVQMAEAGLPLIGDRKYNEKECTKETPMIALCAYRLEFLDPVTGREQTYKINPWNPVFSEFQF